MLNASIATIEARRRAETPPTEPRIERGSSIVVLGNPTATNRELVAAFERLGHRTQLVHRLTEIDVGAGDVVVGRVDVLPTLDGIEGALHELADVERRGALVLNRAGALFAAHDKLTTALFLGRVRVAQPRTAHVRDVAVPSFGPPYVVKPRFGSWGQEVRLGHDREQLRALLGRVQDEPWFRRHGALVQSLVEPTGRDLRVIVAGGRVVGAIERRARPGEWRTNVSLGATRKPVNPSAAARALALRAVAALGIDLAGVDIAGDESNAFRVLEVNGAVDFTPEYGADVFTSSAVGLLRAAAARQAAASRHHDAAADASAAQLGSLYPPSAAVASS